MAANAISTHELNVNEVKREKRVSGSCAPVTLEQEAEKLLEVSEEREGYLSQPVLIAAK
jgi:hypothetical protein